MSEGGGLGIVAAGNAPADYVRSQIRIAKELTAKPFGLNIMLMSPFAGEIARLAAEEKVAVVTTGAGNPAQYMDMWRSAGIKVIPVVASVAMAKLMTRTGASTYETELDGTGTSCAVSLNLVHGTSVLAHLESGVSIPYSS